MDELGERDRHSPRRPARHTSDPGVTIPARWDGEEQELEERSLMWWGIGFGALLYVVLLVTLGVMTLRNGHGWLFFFGIFFPLLWIIGAIMRPPSQYA